jgi:hypothetical protein
LDLWNDAARFNHPLYIGFCGQVRLARPICLQLPGANLPLQRSRIRAGNKIRSNIEGDEFIIGVHADDIAKTTRLFIRSRSRHRPQPKVMGLQEAAPSKTQVNPANCKRLHDQADFTVGSYTQPVHGGERLQHPRPLLMITT